MAWLSGWSRRKKVTVTGTTAGAQTDFQLMLDVTYDSDMLANFDDLRFTTSDGTTLIDFWLESKVDSTSAIVWAEVPSIPANPATVDIYMYYGKADAASASNGANTFEFFDHFEGSSLDSAKWLQTIANGATTVTGSVVTLQGATNVWNVWRAKFFFDVPHVFEYLGKTTEGNSAFISAQASNDPWGTNSLIRWYSDPTKYYWTGNAGTESGDARTSDISAWTRLKAVSTVDNVKFYENDVLGHTKTTNVPQSAMGISFGVAQSTQYTYLDWVFVRKYASPEPTYGTGSEENAGYWFRLQAQNQLQGMRGING